MENQEYLNQISTQVAAPKNKKGLGGILSSKFMLIGVIAVAVFIVIAVIGVALGSGKTGGKDKIVKLKLHADSTVSVIDAYQPNVKSSGLRSSSAALKSVLTNTSSKLSGYMAEKYGDKDGKASKNLTEQAKTEEDALVADLFEAKINGILDRVYAHKMAYEITKFMSEETQIYNGTSNDALKAIIEESYNSLENLYDDFNDFSETK